MRVAVVAVLLLAAVYVGCFWLLFHLGNRRR